MKLGHTSEKVDKEFDKLSFVLSWARKELWVFLVLCLFHMQIMFGGKIYVDP